MENFKNSSVLSQKTAVILGGSTGIGLSVARAAAADGANVIIVSSNKQKLDAALQQLPDTAIAIQANLADETEIARLFEQIPAFDHMVYTAGENLSLYNIADADLDKAKSFFQVRYWGAMAAVKYASAKINAAGSITLTGGIAGARPGAGWSVAASICSAMEGFTRAMAVELAPVRVNLVAPGVVKTDLWNGMQAAEREQFYQTVGQSLPVKRVGQPDDIADAYLYLMKQGFGTGHTLIADGGAVLV